MIGFSQDLSMLVDGVALPLDPAPAGDTAEATLARAVIISLFTWRRARPDDELPDGESRMGWFGDSFAEVNGDRIGSRLWLLARRKLVPRTINEAREMAEEALAWLIEDGVATRVEVIAERMGLSGLALSVRITRTNGAVLDLRFADIWRVIANG